MDSLCLHKKLIDLHTHTTCSDGTDTPEELVKKAYKKNIRVLSITDHDTVSGIEKAVKKAKSLNIEIIPGIEVTANNASLPKGAEFHILGYYIDTESESMKQLVEFFSNSRIERNIKLISKLDEAGYKISYEELEKLYGKNFGKPNIASFMVNHHLIDSYRNAYLLMKKMKVKRKKMPFQEVFRLIKEANGIPVIAHPITLKLQNGKLATFIKKLKDEGLEGIEIYHSEHTPAFSYTLNILADEFSLIKTGGSDYHGLNKPKIILGGLKINENDISLKAPTGVL